MRNVYKVIPIVALLFYLAGCDLIFEQDKARLQTEKCDDEIVQGLKDIPGRYVDVPPEPRPWDTNATVLRDSIAAHDGRAMIGLKAPESERMLDNNGYRAALTAEQFEAALHMLCGKNIEITHVYSSFGAASVIMEPDDVFELFDHPKVDYIEIPMKFYLQS